MSGQAQEWATTAWSSATTAAEEQTARAASGAGNQARVEQLGLAAQGEELLATGLDWAGAALAAGAGGPAVGASMLGLLSRATSEEAPTEHELDLATDLTLEFDLSFDLALQYVQVILSGELGEHPAWARLLGALLEFKDRADLVADVILSIDLIMRADAKVHPADSLRELQAIFGALSAVVPYVPVLTEMITVYGAVLAQAADRLDELASSLQGRNTAMELIAWEGAYSGGTALTNWLKDLHRGEVRHPREGVIEWLMAQADGLQMATGERPPLEKRALFGVDFLAADRVDLDEVTAWCLRHLLAIGRYVWGDLADAYWYGDSSSM